MADGGLVERRVIGGPRDGATVRTGSDTTTWTVYLPPPVTYVQESGMVDFRENTFTYRLTTAPTGEKVFLAPDTVFDERFDTEAWVHRLFRAERLIDLHHIGPWLWRGRHDPDLHDGDPDITPRLKWERDGWVYVTITPDGSLRGRQFVFEPTRLDLADIDVYITSAFKEELAHHLLPECFVDGCNRKAVGGEVDGLWKPEVRDGRWWLQPRELLGPVRACGEHWYDILKVPPSFGIMDGVRRSDIPGWLLPYLRETGLSAFDQAVDIVTTPEREYAAHFRLRHRYTGAWVTLEQYWGGPLGPGGGR